MSGGFQKGGPGRANSVEGGNIVPVVEVGTKRTRPILRGDLVEGLFDWCPDGTYGIYAGFPTDSNVTNRVVQIYHYDVSTNALTDITPSVDCNNVGLTVAAGLVVQFLAVKFAPFFSPAINGYLCWILVTVDGLPQIWLYNGGDTTITVPPPGAGVAAFDLVTGAVNTYDAGPTHLSSYFCLPLNNGGGPPASITPPWPSWDYLAAMLNLGPIRDIGFSWGGDPDPAAAAAQIPYGITVGDGPAVWGDDTVIGTGVGVDYPYPLPNVYCVQFSDGSGVTPRFIPYRSLEYVETNFAVFPEPVVPPTGAVADSHITKITMFRKGLGVITFNDEFVVNRVWEATGNTAVTFVQEAGTTPVQFGRIRRSTDGIATSGLTFTQITGAMTYTSGTQELVMVAGGYVSCTNADLGKTVKSANGAHLGVLLAFNNGTRTWDVRTTATFDTGDVCAVAGGTGRGTITTVSWTPTLPGVDANDPTSRPMYTDTAWGPNRNALYVVGRDGHIKTITNRMWIFANPSDTAYHVDDVQFPDKTTVHTGIQWSPDGVGYLLTSKTFNSDPENSGGAVPIESVSDAFVRNLVTYFSPSTGYQQFTLNEAKVTGFPFTALNQFGQEHYRYAWHPFSRYSLFSVYGGFEKFDQDLFVDMSASLSATLAQPVRVRVQDGNGAALADVITDPFGTNRLAVDAYLDASNTPNAPLFVQDEAQMVLEEFSPGDSEVGTGMWSTNNETTWITTVTDWSTTTGIVSQGTPPSTATLMFRHQTQIARVTLKGHLHNVSVSVIDVEGATHLKINDVTNANGADSGNFSPIVAMGVVITTTVGSPDFTTIYELGIFKSREVKPMNDAQGPLFVEAEQQIVLAEVDSITGTGDFSAHTTLASLFDKELSANPVTYIASDVGTIVATFTHPEMLSRAVLTGAFIEADVITVTFTAASGAVEVINATVGVAGAVILDSDNVLVEPVTGVTVGITADAVSGTRVINELVLWKVVEVKSATNLNPSLTAPYFDAVFLDGGDRVTADGTAYTDPTDLGADPSLSVEIGKDQPGTITALFEADADAGVSSYSLFCDWYVSDNRVDFYNAATTFIGDSATATNPTGYTAAGEVSWKVAAKPVNVYGRYIAIVLRHGSAAGTAGVTVTVNLIRQR